jgi:imidazolonepropionase
MNLVIKPVLFGPITQLLTMKGLPLRGALSDNRLQILPDAGIVVHHGKIFEYGNYKELRYQYDSAEKVEFTTDVVVLPGFIDCHTHLCWAGSRASDFSMRNAGLSYLEIAESGGGIWDTVTQTREASKEHLLNHILYRTSRMKSWGVTTAEVKSGYGLSVDEEIRLLRIINEAAKLADIDIIPTCLAAHTTPKDYFGSAAMYLTEVINHVLPIVKSELLSNRVDIFVERSAFDVSGAYDFLTNAKALGFDLSIHADQFTTGGSTLGVKLGAISLDHLEASTDSEIHAVATSDCVAVALPGASIGLGGPFAPARKLLDSGGILAIASDWNPGSAPMGDLIIQASILAVNQKLSMSEVLSGVTFRAAHALGLSDRGIIHEDMIADFQSYDTSDYREILYQQGLLKPSGVWKNGVKIYESKLG